MTARGVRRGKEDKLQMTMCYEVEKRRLLVYYQLVTIYTFITNVTHECDTQEVIYVQNPCMSVKHLYL